MPLRSSPFSCSRHKILTAQALPAGKVRLGNGLNAIWHRTGHLSIGASTAVFAMVGVLAATQILVDRRSGPRTWFERVAPVVGLLTWARPEEHYAPKQIVLDAVERHAGRFRTEAGDLIDEMTDATGSVVAVTGLLEGADGGPLHHRRR